MSAGGSEAGDAAALGACNDAGVPFDAVIELEPPELRAEPAGDPVANLRPIRNERARLVSRCG